MKFKLPEAPWASLTLAGDGLVLEYAPLERIIMELAKGFEEQKSKIENLATQLADRQTHFGELKQTVEDHANKIVTLSAKPPEAVTTTSSFRPEGQQTRLGKHVTAMTADGKKKVMNDPREFGAVSAAQLEKRLTDVDEKLNNTAAALERELNNVVDTVKRVTQSLEDSVVDIHASLESNNIAAVQRLGELQESAERMDNDLETLRLHWQEDHAMKASKVELESVQDQIRVVIANQQQSSETKHEPPKFVEELSMMHMELGAVKGRIAELLTSLNDESADIRAWALKNIRELTTELQGKSDREECRRAQKSAKADVACLQSCLTDLSDTVSRHFATSADKNEVRKMDRQMEKVEQMLTMRNDTLLGAKCLSCNRSSSADNIGETRVDSQREKDKIRVLNVVDLQKACKESDGTEETMKVVAMNLGRLAHHKSPERSRTDGHLYEVREKTGDVTDDTTFLPIPATAAAPSACKTTPRIQKRRPVHRGYVKPAQDFAATTQWFYSAGLSDILRTP